MAFIHQAAQKDYPVMRARILLGPDNKPWVDVAQLWKVCCTLDPQLHELQRQRDELSRARPRQVGRSRDERPMGWKRRRFGSERTNTPFKKARTDARGDKQWVPPDVWRERAEKGVCPKCASTDHNLRQCPRMPHIASKPAFDKRNRPHPGDGS